MSVNACATCEPVVYDWRGRRIDPQASRGIEVEAILVDAEGTPSARAHEFLERAASFDLPGWLQFTPELAAWQVEIVIGICGSAHESVCLLAQAWQIGAAIAESLGLTLALREVVEIPDHWDFDDFVAPTAYYQQLARRLGLERAKAAAAVSGTHLNLGSGDDETCVLMSDRLLAAREGAELIEIGDYSGGRRIALYREVVPSAIPPRYGSAQGFREIAERNGYWRRRNSCVDLWRLRHGYVELRMFGVPHDVEALLQVLPIWWVRSEALLYGRT